MSSYPGLEARVSAQERRQLNLEVYVEELSRDLTTSIKELSADMTASFKQLAQYLIKTEERFDKIEATMATQKDIADIRATMVTQKDIADIRATLNGQTSLLTQILERLPKNS